MARRGQVGTIAVSGKWYVVRFWKYPAGQDRVHASARICPTDPKAPGYLSKGERRRRASEIVEASGVNDAQQFAETNVGTTFREQAKWFLRHAISRRRNPAKPSTVANWGWCVDKWLNPTLGDLPLASVNNASVKELVSKMHDAKLSAQSVVTYTNLVKLIVASALDGNGEELFPRKWNNEFMDVPVIQKQFQPTFTETEMGEIVALATGKDRVLYALLAGSGLRVGEALGLEIKHLSHDCRTITIEQSCWQGKMLTPKTKAGYRQVDICGELATMLKAHVAERRGGWVFSNGAGRPLSQTNLIRRSLHPILEKIGATKTGFHAMRRFRTTWLRKQRAPEDLIRFWLGHAKPSVTDGYSKLDEDAAYRLEVAEKAGLGFTIPTSVEPMRPMRPKIERTSRTEVAA